MKKYVILRIIGIFLWPVSFLFSILFIPENSPDNILTALGVLIIYVIPWISVILLLYSGLLQIYNDKPKDFIYDIKNYFKPIILNLKSITNHVTRKSLLLFLLSTLFLFLLEIINYVFVEKSNIISEVLSTFLGLIMFSFFITMVVYVLNKNKFNKINFFAYIYLALTLIGFIINIIKLIK